MHEKTDDAEWCNPALFPDAQKAVERIVLAAEHQEKVALFGDYDCDGVTSSAQMIRALRRKGIEPIVRLPHRVHDGYGLKPTHIDEFAEKGVKLIITVDTGITAHEAIDKANSLGINVIILDHHHLVVPPNAYAILHPALSPNFPHPHPSAAGVVFIFLHALENGIWADRDTDLAIAMFGTVADLVQLRGHNRTLVREGLAALRRLPPGPVRLLAEQAAPTRTLTSTDIAFRIAPRINAAGRMADPMLALRALLEGGTLIGDLETLNTLRQDQTTRALEHALLDITPRADGSLPPFISIASNSYPHGILGLLAGKLTERYGRPSMAVHIDGELCTASLRSPATYSIVEALQRHAHLLINFGGHAQAAGATFSLQNYLALAESLEHDADSRLTADDLTPVLAADATLPASAITVNFCKRLTELEPYGQGNAEPLFMLENVKLENVRRVGGDMRHLSASIGGCKAIGFGLGDLAEHAYQPVDLLCRAGIDSWNGREMAQLFIVDVRAAAPVATAVGSRF